MSVVAGEAITVTADCRNDIEIGLGAVLVAEDGRIALAEVPEVFWTEYSFGVAVDIPLDTAPGAYRVSITCAPTDDEVVGAPFTPAVVAIVVTTPPVVSLSSLPATR